VKLWQDEDLAPHTVAVNLSAAQCKRSKFEQEIANCLASTGVDASRIELELTESVLMEATRKHCDTIQRLRNVGMRIAIDDFGTGYSCLTYLTRFPVDRIKIARELILRVASNYRHAAVVRAIIGLAKELEIEVIAEGVENLAQERFLIAAGCALAQGFYYGAPVNSHHATKLLRQRILRPQHS
jgi:EAL domain-containing protein (putative c-di-GMP-specific phosphodiesterase class I)